MCRVLSVDRLFLWPKDEVYPGAVAVNGERDPDQFKAWVDLLLDCFSLSVDRVQKRVLFAQLFASFVIETDFSFFTMIFGNCSFDFNRTYFFVKLSNSRFAANSQQFFMSILELKFNAYSPSNFAKFLLYFKFFEGSVST